MKNMISKLNNFIALNQKKVITFFFVLAIIFPFIASNAYYIGIAIMALVYSILTLSLNLITGFLGITSLGQAAFFGIGAYSAAILSTRFGISFIGSLLAAFIISGIFGILLGLPTLRIKGRYLAIVTLGFSEIIRMIELNWMGLTRGPQGISGIPGIKILGLEFNDYKIKYYVGILLLVLVLIAIVFLINSSHGRAIRAIKDDELAAETMGVNVYKYKVIIFGLSSAIAGIAGSYYAHYMSFIDPNAFNFEQSILILSMAILGGMGSLPGSIIGAITLSVLPEVLRFMADYRQIIYGVILVIIVIFRPSGIMGDVDYPSLKNKIIVKEEVK